MSRRAALVLAFALIVLVFAVELPFVLWRVRYPALIVISPLLSIGMLFILVYPRYDTPQVRRWFTIAVFMGSIYGVLALVIWLRVVTDDWRALQEARLSLVTVLAAVIGIVAVVALSSWRTKPPDPNRTLIQTWRARFR